MKRIVALCLAIVLLLSFTMGVLAEDKVTLTFAETMTSPERTLVLENAIKAFEAAHPGITVELVSPPYESAETKVASMLAAGQEVDTTLLPYLMLPVDDAFFQLVRTHAVDTLHQKN